MNQCSNCGFNVNDNVNICPNCGSQIMPVRNVSNNGVPYTSVYASQPSQDNTWLKVLIIIAVVVVVIICGGFGLRCMSLQKEAKEYLHEGVHVPSNEELYYSHEKSSWTAGTYVNSKTHDVYDTYIDYIKGDIWLEVRAVIDGNYNYYWVVR